jgi:hypothetical protein
VNFPKVRNVSFHFDEWIAEYDRGLDVVQWYGSSPS